LILITGKNKDKKGKVACATYCGETKCIWGFLGKPEGKRQSEDPV
jgi:hypothetical protein